MKQTFYSNGKLLVLGEYTVLDGSDAFALPTWYGQYLDTENSNGNMIDWESYDADGSLWFKEKIPFRNIINNSLNGNKLTDTLTDILHTAHNLNPALLNQSEGFTMTTRLTFPRNWGLGSSSTLINNIAQWFKVDAFDLLRKSFGGSGYDIACAQYNTPILFSLQNAMPHITPINFNPPFTDKLYFVYLNKKQNTRSAVQDYRKNAGHMPQLTEQVNQIIKEACNADSFEDFCRLLDLHSGLMSQVLQLPTVKQELFADFSGTVKSLGAWGGDFILAASPGNPSDYFKSKGYPIILSYK